MPGAHGKIAKQAVFIVNADVVVACKESATENGKNNSQARRRERGKGWREEKHKHWHKHTYKHSEA